MLNPDKSQSTHAIGERLRALRLEHQMTQQAFAGLIGISKSHYSKIEVGIGSIGDAPLKKAALQFGTSFDWLRYGENPKKEACGTQRAETIGPLPSHEEIVRIIQLLRSPKIIQSAEKAATVLGISLPRALRVIISSMH